LVVGSHLNRTWKGPFGVSHSDPTNCIHIVSWPSEKICTQPEPYRRELLQAPKVLDDGDARGQEERVHGARSTAGIVDVHRVDADQRRALGHQPLGRAARQERGTSPVVLGPEVAVPPGVHQHRLPSHLEREEKLTVDGAAGGSRDAHHDAFEVGHRIERSRLQVGAIGVAVEGRVEVGAGVRHHGDAPDVELGPFCVARPRGFPAEVLSYLRPREPGVRHHPVPNGVTQLDQATHVHT
jgi:hypothetical protein